MRHIWVGMIIATVLATGCSRDFELPQVGDGPISDLQVAPDPARAGVDVMIAFKTAAVPTGDPVVELAGRFASKLSGPGAENRFTYRYIAVGDEPEGQATPVSVTARLSGDVRVDTTITFDFTPPKLIAHTISPAIAGVGETITLTLDGDERLAPPKVKVRDLVFACTPGSASGADQRFLCTATPDGSEIQGPFTLDVTLIDLAGNQTAILLPEAGELRFGDAPILSDLRAAPRIAKIGDTLTVDFLADRQLAPTSTVAVSQHPLEQTAELELISGWSYSYARVVSGDESEGPVDVEILAVDVGGATTTASVPIVLDFQPPGYERATLTPERLGVGDAFELTVVEVDGDPFSAVSGNVGFPAYQLPMRCARAAGRAWTCLYDALGLEPEETPMTVTLVLADLAGNTALLSAGSATFDFSCRYPGAPIRARVDWRDDVELVAEAGAFEGNASIAVRDGAAGATSRTVIANADGSLSAVTLAGISDPWVIATDPLGNECSLIRPVSSFRADGRGYYPGAPLPNPSRYLSSTLDQRLAPLPATGGTEVASPVYRDLDRVDASFFTLTVPPQADGTGPRWYTPNPTTVPPPRYRHAGTYHRAMQRFVVTSGKTLNGQGLIDTWSWDGVQWRQPTLFSPGATCDAQLVYDTRIERAILFAGNDCGSPTTGVPAMWSLGTDGWRQEAFVPGTPPTIWDYHAVYDPIRDEIIVAGGWMRNTAGTGNLVQTKTFAWNGGWRRLSTALLGAVSSAMAFDPVAGLGVRFGGRSTVNNQLMDLTRSWDGTTWTALSPANSPPPSEEHVMTYDSHRKRVLSYGGWGGDDKMWEWDGTNWSSVAPTGAPTPTILSASTMGYDEARGRTVIMGGEDQNSFIYWEVYEYGYPWKFPIVRAHLAGRADLPATVDAITVSAVAGATGASLDAAGVEGAELFLWNRQRENWDLVATHTVPSATGPGALLTATFSGAALTPYLDSSRAVEVLLRSREGATHLGGATLEVDALWMDLDGP